MFQTRTNRRIRDILWLPDGQLGLVHDDAVRVCWLSPGAGKLKTVRTFQSFHLKNSPFLCREGKLQRIGAKAITTMVRPGVFHREYAVYRDIEGQDEWLRHTHLPDERCSFSGELFTHGDTCVFVETDEKDARRIIRDAITGKVVQDYHINAPLHDQSWRWRFNIFSGEDGSLFSHDNEDVYIWKNGVRGQVKLATHCGHRWTHPFVSRSGDLFVVVEHVNFMPYYQHRDGRWHQCENLPIWSSSKGYGLTSDAYGRLYYSFHGLVRVYDPVKRVQLRTFNLSDSFSRSRISVSPDSTRLAVWEKQDLVVLDIE